MKLFTKEIDKKLFAQYPKGNNLEEQMVVGKIFNPYGNGRWYLLNSDPTDPDYLWAIVQMGKNVEIGSVSRKELESIRVSPFRFPLERDLGFRPVNAYELWKGLRDGKFYKDGGFMEQSENKEMVLSQAEELEHHVEEFEEAAKKSNHVPAWIVAKTERAATDLSDSAHYLDSQNELKREEKEGEEEYAHGGEVKWQEAEYGDSALVISENKMGIIMKPYGRKFHLKFVDGTEKTYDANDLKFFKDMDEFDLGGETSTDNYKMAKGGWIKSDKQEDFYLYSTPDKKIKTPYWYSVHEVKDIGNKETLHWAVERGGTNDMGYLRNYARKNFKSKDEALKYAKSWEKEIANKYKWSASKMAEGGMMENGGSISSPNTEFMKWFVDWSKDVNKYVYVSITKPNEFSSPVKDDSGKIVILDVIEKKGDADAKKYINEMLKKADEFGVSIYLQPIPRTHNLKSQEHKEKITKDYLVKYYQKFGFENTDGGFMVRAPKMAEGGETKNDNYSNWVFWKEEYENYIKDLKERIKADYDDDEVSFLTKQQEYEVETYEDKLQKHLEKGKQKGWYGKGGFMAEGGEVKFKDKVASIKKSLLKRKKVPKAVQKDYGKTFSPAEAEDSAKRIVGAQTARERLMMRIKSKKKK